MSLETREGEWDLEYGDYVTATEWFDVYNNDFGPHFPCQARLDDLDRHVVALRESMNLDDASRFDAVFHRPCAVGGVGSLTDRVMYVCSTTADLHEVTHVVHGVDLGAAGTGGKRMLLEGFAESSESHGRLMPRLTPSLALAPAAWSGVDRSAAYRVSGHFIRWLIDDFGFAAFRSAYKRKFQSSDQNGGELASVIASVTDESWESLAQRYLESAPVARAGFGRCKSEPDAVVDASFTYQSFDLSLLCGDAETWGPVFRDPESPGALRRLTVDVLEDAELTVDADRLAFTWEPCDDLQDVDTELARARYLLGWEADSYTGLITSPLLEDVMYFPDGEIRSRTILPAGRYSLALLKEDASSEASHKVALHRKHSAARRVAIRPFEPVENSPLAPHI